MSIKLALDGRIHDVTIARRRPHLVLLIDGEEHEISELPELGDGRKSMSIGGHHIDFARAVLGHRQAVRLGGRTFEIGYVDPFSESTSWPLPAAVLSENGST